MSLPDLCLLPHEMGDLAPDEPLCAPAIARVKIGRWWCRESYLLRPVRTTTFPTEWIARRESSPTAPLLRLFWPPSAELEEILISLKQGKFMRVLYFDEQIRLMTSLDVWHYALCIGHDGVAVWSARNGESAAFGWLKPNSKLSTLWRAETTDSDIEHYLRQMLKDNDSDCAFALNWLQLSETEKDTLLVQVAHGNLEECRQLLWASLWIDSIWLSSQRWRWNIDIGWGSDYEAPTSDPRVMASRSDIENEIQGIELSPRLLRLLEIILAHFKLSHNRQTQSKTLVCNIRNLDNSCWNVPVPTPTAHEILEARLRLRDFLRDKLSPAELNELMPQ